MKNRIVKIQSGKDISYCIQTKFLGIWWDETMEWYGCNLRYTYKTLEEAKRNLKGEQEKEIITVVY